MKTFNNIDWKAQLEIVENLQEKLVVAWKKGNLKQVQRLQTILIRSFAARALAVKKVLSNNGGDTPGVDKIVWNTEELKNKAISTLRKDSKVKPLKRIYIPKGNNGKMRPLSIPSMLDRAKQALHLLALDPIAEEVSDERSYGFRKYRNCQDAVEYIYLCLNQKNRARYILDADIKGFFDNINHEWILNNIPMDKTILAKWLKAGYLDKKVFFDTEFGVPQGGIISPTIANMVLNGIEKVIKESIESKITRKNKPKVNIVRYADDLIVTAATKELLEKNVIPAIETFLKERGLELNMDKTVIKTITEGFDFLGFNFRKFKDLRRDGKEMLIKKPSNKAITNIKQKIKTIISTYQSESPYILISKLNPLLRGWGQYFRTAMSKRTYTKVNFYVWTKLWQWALKKHPNLGKRKLKSLYFMKVKNRDWIFFGKTEKNTIVQLFDITSIPIISQIICKNLNPYLKENKEYFESRIRKSSITSVNFNELQRNLLKISKGICKVCNNVILPDEQIDIHHILSKKDGGKNNIKNLIILHKICHRNVTYNKDPKIKARYIELGIIKPALD